MLGVDIEIDQQPIALLPRINHRPVVVRIEEAELRRQQRQRVVRQRNHRALGAMHDRAATSLPALTVLAEKDADESVRKAANEAIGSIRRRR